MAKRESEIPNIDICSLSEQGKEDLVVSNLAIYLRRHRDLVFPHRHNFYQLVLFTKGAGEHIIDFSKFPVKPLQIYFMTPGQVHTWNFEGDVDGYVVNFSPDFFQSFLLRPDYLDSFSFWKGNSEAGVLEVSRDGKVIIKLFEELLTQMLENNQGRGNDAIRVTLLLIFMRIEQITLGNAGGGVSFKANSVIQNFQKLVEKNFWDMHLPSQYAGMLNVTTNHLNALSKEHLGKQAGEVIRDRIILEAKRMLVSLDLTVTEVAYKLDFNDNSYFTKFFRKVTGITPDEFRKRSI